MALVFEILVSVYTRFNGDTSGLVRTLILPGARTGRKSEGSFSGGMPLSGACGNVVAAAGGK